jgi:hypothetical protein
VKVTKTRQKIILLGPQSGLRGMAWEHDRNHVRNVFGVKQGGGNAGGMEITKSEVSRTSTTTLNRELSIFNDEGGTRIDAVQSAHMIARLRLIQDADRPASCYD